MNLRRALTTLVAAALFVATFATAAPAQQVDAQTVDKRSAYVDVEQGWPSDDAALAYYVDQRSSLGFNADISFVVDLSNSESGRESIDEYSYPLTPDELSNMGRRWRLQSASTDALAVASDAGVLAAGPLDQKNNGHMTVYLVDASEADRKAVPGPDSRRPPGHGVIRFRSVHFRRTALSSEEHGR